jgi:hypothetical protein
MTPDQAMTVLRCWEQAGLYEDLFWRVTTTDGVTSVVFLANCSDLFYWATADCEEITPEDFPLLEQTRVDLEAIGAAYVLNELFAARKRKLRPQKPCYKGWSPALAALFDACCTEEERAEADRRDRDWWVAFAYSQKDRKK